MLNLHVNKNGKINIKNICDYIGTREGTCEFYFLTRSDNL